MRIHGVLTLAVLGMALAMSPVHAQVSSDEPATRFPPEGIAILDCAPPAPAPDDSCVVRVPPNQLRTSLRRSSLDATNSQFNFVRNGSDNAPSDLTVSATVLLVDLTPGSAGGRRKSWDFERDQIAAVAREMPSDEMLAVYGFNEGLVQIVDFTTDKDAVVRGIEGIELEGLNTRIAAQTIKVIELLDERPRTVLKNIVLFTDGDDEGVTSTDEVVSAAVNAGVTISALGLYWRPSGTRENGAGRDYLAAISSGALGSSVGAEMSSTERRADAEVTVDQFAQNLRSAISGSGLVVPSGTIGKAEIIVTMKEPIAGQAGQYTDREIRATFVPEGYEETGDGTEPSGEENVIPEDDRLLGLPATWVYVGGAVLLLLLIAGGAYVVSRKSGKGGGDEGVDGLFAGDDDNFSTAFVEPVPAQAAPKPAPPPVRPIAILEMEASGERLPITSARTSIGRGGSNAIVLNHDSVSRAHAELHRNRDGGFSLTDLDSLNGTYHNDLKLNGTRPVRIGDALKFGEVVVRLKQS